MKIPKIPYDRPSLLNKRDDSVRLQWLPAPVYDLPDDARRISYVVESREVPSQTWTKLATGVPSTSYIVKHLRPDKEYEFRVRAQNQHGISEPTWNSTLERRFGQWLYNITQTLLTLLSLFCLLFLHFGILLILQALYIIRETQYDLYFSFCTL